MAKRQARKVDATNPGHYIDEKMEPIEVIDAMGISEGFCVGNAIKYLMRFEHKNGVEDLRKARWYLNYAIAKKLGAACEDAIAYARAKHSGDR